MLNYLDVISIILTILLISVFYLLFVMQIYSSKSKKIENHSLLVALFTGGLAFILYLVGKLNEVSDQPNVETIINSFSLMFIFFAICFYFWYRHYLSIISVHYERNTNNSIIMRNTVINKLFKPISVIDFVLIIFISISLLSYIFYLTVFFGIADGTIFDFIWEPIGLTGGPGRVVTVTSHLTFLSGAIVFFYIILIIINNNLFEIGMLKVFEIIPIFLMAFINTLLFFNDIGITFLLISPELSTIILNVGLILFFVSMLTLVADYIIVNPPHFQSPSIYKEIKIRLDRLKDREVLKDTELEKINKSPANLRDLNIAIQKLNGISILILMYILRQEQVIAKEIENEFKIKKSTISYNIKMLENYKLIERSSNIERIIQEGKVVEGQELDQRQKIIVINEKGINFLQLLHGNLIDNF